MKSLLRFLVTKQQKQNKFEIGEKVCPVKIKIITCLVFLCLL